MSLSVNAISGSLAATHQIQRTYASLANTMTQLATGSRINSGKDDPAGLVAHELLRSEIAASNAVAKNTGMAKYVEHCRKRDEANQQPFDRGGRVWLSKRQTPAQ